MKLAATHQIARAEGKPAAPSASGSVSAAPTASTPAVQRQVFGYVNAGNFKDPSVGYATWQWQLLTTVAYFGVHVNSDGSLSSSDLSGWSSNASTLVNTAHQHGVKAVLSIVQQSQSTLCSSLAGAQTTVSAVIANLDGADGVNIDYEGSQVSCSDTSGDTMANRLDNLARLFRQQLPAAQANLTIATYASAAAFPGGFFDIRGLAQYVNQFFVMAYDMDGSLTSGNWQSPPLSCSSYCFSPTAPLTTYSWNDTRAAETYLAVVPPSQVIMGVPYYGYTACVAPLSSSRPGPNAYAWTSNAGWTAPTYLDSITTNGYTGVSNWAEARDAHDTSGNEPYSTWQSSTYNCWRESYWDDTTSLGNKYDLVNNYDLAGAGLFALDYGGGDSGLWSELALKFTNLPAAPTNFAACAGQGSASVSWSAPYSPHGAVTSYRVSAVSNGSVVSTQTPGAGATFGTFTGLSSSLAYSFMIQALNGYGAGPGATTAPVTPWASPALATSYFTWYDRASPGMNADNLHLVAGSGGSTASQGCITIPSVAVLPFSISPGAEGIFDFPAGVIGGPVQLNLFQGNPISAAQRVQYYQSFNEVPAQPSSTASTALQFAWYDHKSSPGFLNDNIHVLNPGNAAASVSVAIPGCPAQSQPSLAPGAEAIFNCGNGFGGPVTLSSSAPVLASQRVQYYQSFNEEWAQDPTKAAASLQFAWYDHVSSPGFQNDNLHIWNAAAAGTATGMVGIPGCPSQPLSIAAGAEQIFSCSNGYGGPVTITSSAPVLASQRVQYYESFNEVPAAAASGAATSLRFAWYDHSSSAGFQGDNLHVFAPAGSLTPNQVTVSIPNCSPPPPLQASASELIYSCPFGSGFGGPVLITSQVPVLASQRVQYYQSFNEVWAS